MNGFLPQNGLGLRRAAARSRQWSVLPQVRGAENEMGRGLESYVCA